MRLIIFFLFFFVFNTAFPQQKRDMTEKEYSVLKDKIRFYYNANVDSAMIYANQMAKSNNYKHLVFANAAMSSLLQMKREEKKSKEKYKKALQYLEKMPESRDKTQLKGYVYNYGGLGDMMRGNYGVALEKFQQGIKFSIEVNDISQILKFKGNMIMIHDAVGNYQLAIKNSKELLHFIDTNEDLFAKSDVLNRRSNTNLSLGSVYEGYFNENHDRLDLLDSAAYFYKKTIMYSDRFPYNKTCATLSLGNIFNWKSDYKSAEKTYLEVIALSKRNNIAELMCAAYYNLGDIYKTAEMYNKALLFYKKSDSVALLSGANEYTYLKSNCYQARIYNELNKPELAHIHSKIYLDRYEKFETRLRDETLEVNYKQGINDLTAEMVSIDEKYKQDLLLTKALRVFCVCSVIGIVLLLIKNVRDKKKAHKKMSTLIIEFKKNQLISKPVSLENEDSKPKKENSLNIDQAIEDKIIERLLELENTQEYLNEDFTLSSTAKKIKTNTTYLSYVVKKRFGKSFGEYANELKINYVINEMITNPAYRKCSTQATAASVGFKNASSFAKSFRKRTGVSPAQFANNI
jgi:AraC-like DNA-binding protein